MRSTEFDLLKASRSPVRIFVSHRRSDAAVAVEVGKKIRAHIPQAFAYVDELDPALNGNSENLTDYFRGILALCSHLIAVVSADTQGSWWVPFEIGIATERDCGLATYAVDETRLPDFLRKWPYLRALSEVDTYVREAHRHEAEVVHLKRYAGPSAATPGQHSLRFQASLKQALGQR